MSRGLAREVGGLVSGVLFGAGLIVSGMTDPTKVLGFLDLLGPWDPSLALVMVGAIAVHAVGLRLLSRRAAPWAAPAFSVSPPSSIDARLVLGALVFGVGWGLSGYCPGPALVSLPSAGVRGFAFVASLALGNGLGSVLEGPGFRGLPRPFPFARLTGRRQS